MTPERWQRVKQLFEAALQRNPTQRAAFLAEVCKDDDALRKDVESLVSSHEEAGSLIESPALAPTVSLAMEDQAGSAEERRIGSYKLIREIGRGGMGEVYLAVRADDQYQKRVAIKLVKRGMDTEAILRRFRNERQILAALDHPNIARLFDGGTTEEGLPYFVMEYIEGNPIGDFCDTRKLNTVERLRLFRMVCSAVHHAHQNLVVHRDIKPGNILVTPQGAPKLLDFGIAKLLHPEFSADTIAPTATAVRVMTPEYASPEQVRGEPITTASDVYSLGVLLYELLTGRRPYRLRSRVPNEVVRVICEEEPEKPSTAVNRVEEAPATDGTSWIALTPELVSNTREGQPDKLRRRLAGDLDNIVLKAMRKEPQRRYASVEHFSEDIRRHLEGLPVIARKDTLGYRTGKFIKRHKVGVAAVAMIVTTLLAGIIVARTERAKAERRFNDVRRLANSFMFEVHDAIEDLPGSTPARQLVVKRAMEYLDSLAQESGDDPSLQRELATAYEKVGDVQGSPGAANLGNTAGALESYRKALAIREALHAVDPTNPKDRRGLAKAYSRIGVMTGDLENYRKALAIREALYASDPTNTWYRGDLAISYYEIGDNLAGSDDLAGALENHRKALTTREELSTNDPANAGLRHNVKLANQKMGAILTKTGDRARALEHYRKALEIDKARSAANPTSAEARLGMSFSYSDIGLILAETGDTAGALDHYRKALAIREELAAADPKNKRTRYSLAITHNRIGWILEKIGDAAGALEYYRKALAIREALSAAHPTDADIRSQLASSRSDIARIRTVLASNAKKSVAVR